MLARAGPSETIIFAFGKNANKSGWYLQSTKHHTFLGLITYYLLALTEKVLVPADKTWYSMEEVIGLRTYLFDFDGTLVDSMPVYGETMLRILDDNNIAYDESFIKVITPLGVEKTAEYCVNLGLKMTKEAVVSLMKERLVDAYLYRIPAKQNVIAVLKELKKRGAGMSILTASPHITLDGCLKRLGIYDLFDNVWSCDDFHTTKVDVNIYKMAAQIMGKSLEEILFLDDNLNADITAKRAGMVVCGVYDASSEDYTDEIKKNTDYYIYDFKELLEIPE